MDVPLGNNILYEIIEKKLGRGIAIATKWRRDEASTGCLIGSSVYPIDVLGYVCCRIWDFVVLCVIILPHLLDVLVDLNFF